MYWVKEHLLKGGSVQVKTMFWEFSFQLTQISRDPLVHTYMHTRLLYMHASCKGVPANCSDGRFCTRTWEVGYLQRLGAGSNSLSLPSSASASARLLVVARRFMHRSPVAWIQSAISELSRTCKP
jgi:hypothetical protein